MIRTYCLPKMILPFFASSSILRPGTRYISRRRLRARFFHRRVINAGKGIPGAAGSGEEEVGIAALIHKPVEDRCYAFQS